MKRSIYIGGLFLLSMLSGCKEEYLDVTPETYQNANNFFKTKEQFVQAVNAAYSPMQGLFTGSFWALGEMRSDNTSYQYNTTDRSGFPLEEIDEFREQINNPQVSGYFNNCFAGISRCNLILDRIEAANIETAVKNQVSGEARFLRAFYYFQLVRAFGEVPLVLQEVKSTDEAFATAARKTASEVYAVIVADAQAAIEMLPEVYTSATDKGRATKGTARTLLAKVYMTQKNFTEANTQLRAIVQSNRYQLNTNYADNFSITRKNGPESILEVQFMEGTVGEFSNFIYTFAPYNSGSAVAGFALATGAAAGWNIPTQDLINAYEANDTRRTASISQL